MAFGVEHRTICSRDWRPIWAVQRLEKKTVEKPSEASEVEIDIKLARTDLWRLIAEDYSRRQDFFTVLANKSNRSQKKKAMRL